MSNKAITSYANTKGLVSNAITKALTTYTNLTAEDIKLIARVLDQEFPETVTMSESHAMTIAKVLSDTIDSISESHVMAVGKALAETPTMSESLARTVIWARTFAETPSVAEAIALAISHPESDSASVGESHAMSVGQASSDAFGFNETTVFSLGVATSAINNIVTMSESHAINIAKALADSATMSESFSATLALGNNSKLNESQLNTYTLNG